MSKKVNTTLLIDDSDIDLFIQRRFLEVYQFSNELIPFKSAKEALNWLVKLNGAIPPDIIFLDLNMPEMDGFEFLKSFESLSDSIQTKTKIVVLTSSNSSKDRDQVFENANVIQFITKPLKQDDIEDLQAKLSLNGQARS
jgi:two-component system, NarL family, nitrate/nitrite response regulator NarL